MWTPGTSCLTGSRGHEATLSFYFSLSALTRQTWGCIWGLSPSGWATGQVTSPASNLGFLLAVTRTTTPSLGQHARDPDQAPGGECDMGSVTRRDTQQILNLGRVFSLVL